MMLAEINLADMMFLMTIFIGPASAFGAARGLFKAGTPLAILGALGGLLVGYFLGGWANKAAYAALRSEKLPGELKLFLYTLIPVLTLLFVAFVPGVIWALIRHLR